MTMDDPIAVRLEAVSKKYRLFGSKKDRLLEALHPFRKTFHKEFWALKDISLEIPRGHTVGILGLNGSGKSTLLQIISSVLRPTSGTVTVTGRIAALLELGAGLNPELTGRENVVMNSAIMGFDSERTLKRMEEIEAFADIGEFFDQPMKTYSSGMYMRVAFATSIFVDPDILIIDEALAVGDGKFAEKCFSRIRRFREDGKTILLVTHDRSTIPRLCDLGVLLHRGRMLEMGEAKRIVDLYTEIMAFGDLSTSPHSAAAKDVAAPVGEAEGAKNEISPAPGRPGPTPPAGAAAPRGVPVRDKFPDEVRAYFDARENDDCRRNPTYNKYEHRFGNGNASIDNYCIVQDGRINSVPVMNDRPIDIYVKIAFKAALDNPLVGISVTSSQGVLVFSTHSGWLSARTASVQAGDVRIYRLSLMPRLGPGDWFVEIAVAENSLDMCDVRSKVIHLTVTSTGFFDGLAQLDAAFAEMDQRHQATPGPS